MLPPVTMPEAVDGDSMRTCLVGDAGVTAPSSPRAWRTCWPATATCASWWINTSEVLPRWRATSGPYAWLRASSGMYVLRRHFVKDCVSSCVIFIDGQVIDSARTCPLRVFLTARSSYRQVARRCTRRTRDPKPTPTSASTSLKGCVPLIQPRLCLPRVAGRCDGGLVSVGWRLVEGVVDVDHEPRALAHGLANYRRGGVPFCLQPLRAARERALRSSTFSRGCWCCDSRPVLL